MPQTEAEWMTSSRPYRILAHAIELKRAGKLETEEGQAWLRKADEIANILCFDPTLSDYGRFRVQGYRKAMEA